MIWWSVRSPCNPGDWLRRQILQCSSVSSATIPENTCGAAFAIVEVMNPIAEALKKRTHDFFVRVIRLCGMLPDGAAASNISEQLVRSSGSVDSNYGAACKSRTRKLFVDKVGIAAEEADESKRWLEAVRDAELGATEEVASLVTEANELTAILVASHKTAKARLEEAERRAAAARAARRSRRSRAR